MARFRQSLQLTSRYSRQLETTAARVSRIAEARWDLAPSDFDGSYATWLDAVVPAVTQAQRQNQRLTTAYLTAFIASEMRRRPRLKTVGSVAGTARDGRPLREAWDSPPIKAKIAMSEGKTVTEATDIARTAAMSLVSLDVYHGARTPMAEMLDITEETAGYTRVTGGNPCGACLALADGSTFATDEIFEVHPSCDCVAEPVLSGVEDRVTRPTGQEIFEAEAAAKQNEMLGAEAAQAVRDGKVSIAQLKDSASGEYGFIYQKPLKDT